MTSNADIQVHFHAPRPRVHILSLLCTLAAIGLAACGSDSSPSQSPQDEAFGPLAVIDGRGGGADAGGGTGPIHIEEACVTMTHENGEAWVLIWQSDDVAWNEEAREITYTTESGQNAQPTTLRDGDTISLGGEAMEGDVPTNRNLPWLATPAPGCDAPQWIVTSLIKQ